jgi:hypothetical protein
MAKRFICGALLYAALAVAEVAGADVAVAKTKVFSSGPVARAIPDPAKGFGAEIGPSIKINARGRVQDVDVAVRISHPEAWQLEIGASHIPSGGALTGMVLKEHGSLADPKGPGFGARAAGCEGATFTVFDSGAPASILQGAPPFAGVFAPIGRLSAFNRTQLRGRWYLDLLDIQEGAAGTLDCWQLKVRYKPPREKRR